MADAEASIKPQVPGPKTLEPIQKVSAGTPTENKPIEKKPIDTKTYLLIGVGVLLLIALIVGGYFAYKYLVGRASEPSDEVADDEDNADNDDEDGNEEDVTDDESPQDPDTDDDTPPAETEFSVTSVVAEVDGDATVNTCPATFDFIGHIAATAAGTVSYKWQKSDGSSSSVRTLNFSDAGVKNITDYSLTGINATSTGWVKLTITVPNSISSSNVTWRVTCPPVADFSGTWTVNDGYVVLTQNGTSVSGTFTNELAIPAIEFPITGTVAGDTFSGILHNEAATLPFTWNMLTDDNSMTGLAAGGGGSIWCGAKQGHNFPSGCAFAGTWDEYVYGGCADSNNTLHLTVTAGIGADPNRATVSGTYCYGTIHTGEMYFSGGAVWMLGSWDSNGGGHGTLQFKLEQPYATVGFQGRYNDNDTYEWCGWVDAYGKPDPCHYIH